jgi:hypothetical protein
MGKQYKFWTAWHLKMRPIGGPETSARNYHSAFRRIPKERRSHLHRSGSPNSRQLFSFVVLTCLAFSLVYVRHSKERSTYYVNWSITKILGRNQKLRAKKTLSQFPSFLRSNTIISLHPCAFWKWLFNFIYGIKICKPLLFLRSRFTCNTSDSPECHYPESHNLQMMRLHTVNRYVKMCNRRLFAFMSSPEKRGFCDGIKVTLRDKCRWPWITHTNQSY